MAFDGWNIFQLASELGLPELERSARAAGVMSIWQVTAYYAERSLRHSAARLIEYQTGELELWLAYEGIKLGKPLRLSLERERIEKLQAVLLGAKFGKLGDQAGLSYSERSLWLIQRAAGGHSHGIVLAPDRPELPYSAIVNAIDAYLPEAIREIPLR